MSRPSTMSRLLLLLFLLLSVCTKHEAQKQSANVTLKKLIESSPSLDRQ
jgi:hypothetical protein